MGQRWMDGSWDAHLASPAYFFAGADNITKKREPGIKIIKRTSESLIITSVYLTIIPRARVGYEMIDSQRGA